MTSWVEVALRTSPAETRILVKDAKGRARPVREQSRKVIGHQRLRQRVRRRALRNKRSLSASLQGGLAVAVFPMVSRGESFGAIEVAAPEVALVERWSTLEAVASQGAIALRHISQAAELQEEGRRMGALVSLSRDLLAASSPFAAIQESLTFLHAEFGGPVAAWLAPAGSDRLDFVGAHGVDAASRRKLKAWSPTFNASESERARLAERFKGLVGTRDVEVLRVRGGILLLGASTAEARQALEVIGPLLDTVIGLLSDVASARLRSERLDLGIAWTAHELRSPLVALRALLDLEAMSPEGAREHTDLRASAMRDLAGLLQQVEDLLRWAVGGRRLRRRPTELVQLVREAVAAASPEGAAGRVVLQGPESLHLAAEPADLRLAITNVIQNAVTYSPREAPVKVSIGSSDGGVEIKVIDQGPGVSSAEAQEIFDPLVRGEASQGRRTGHGLGLFIARRIVEAHGGSIRIEPRSRGATFLIELPTPST
jgi:signal transduction histidine kinase